MYILNDDAGASEIICMQTIASIVTTFQIYMLLIGHHRLIARVHSIHELERLLLLDHELIEEITSTPTEVIHCTCS